MHASNKPVSEDKEEDDVFSRCPLYCGSAGSDVIGCRRPTGGVLYMYASYTGHADSVPHSNPLVDAVRSSHEGELVFLLLTILFQLKKYCCFILCILNMVNGSSKVHA